MSTYVKMAKMFQHFKKEANLISSNLKLKVIFNFNNGTINKRCVVGVRARTKSILSMESVQQTV